MTEKSIISDLEKARNNILRVFIENGQEITIDDYAARVNAECAYGDIIAVAIKELKDMGSITPVTKARFNSAVRNEPKDEHGFGAGRAAEYHSRFKREIKPILAKL